MNESANSESDGGFHGSRATDAYVTSGDEFIDDTTGLATGLKLLANREVWTPEVVQRVVTLALLMAVTLTGNVAIIATLSCGSNRKLLSSRVNIFIVNLAVADLTVCCFTMTTEVLFVSFKSGWVLGWFACKLLLYLQIFTLASITFILTAMSFDRYLAICRPLRSITPTNSRRRRMVLASWLMAAVFAIPQLAIFKQVSEGVYPDGVIRYQCVSRGYTAWWQRKTYFTFLTCYILVLPSILMSFCYIKIIMTVWTRSREMFVSSGRLIVASYSSTGEDEAELTLRKSVRNNQSLPRAKVRTIQMTLSIILTFVVCWTPYFVVHLVHIWSEYNYVISESVYAFAENLALVNPAVNPIIYACFNGRLRRILSFLCCRSSDYLEQTAPTTHRCTISVKREPNY